MTIYMANENGDWWVYDINSPLYVLRSEDIPDDIDKESIEGDKFEDIIQEHGNTMFLMLGRKEKANV